MVKDIFINLAVKDLNKSIAFFTQLGFTFNPQFTDETATCMILGEHIYAMLLTEEKFKSFTTKKLVDAKAQVEVLTCLGVDSREKVDELVATAIASGGSTSSTAQDHGFMYWHSFEDLDGHTWELTAMVTDA
ncbi:MAG: VOC family protein [Spongiibacteraceae bacterium]